MNLTKEIEEHNALSHNWTISQPRHLSNWGKGQTGKEQHEMQLQLDVTLQLVLKDLNGNKWQLMAFQYKKIFKKHTRDVFLFL